MKTKFNSLFIMLALLALVHQAVAQGTAFTYQGRLNSGTNPATGNYDLTFTLFNASSGGSDVAGPLTNSATGVSNGLFLVTLDFGGIFNGTDYWLEIGVRTNGNGVFTTLAPRQQITPTPYALFATTASNLSGSISSANLAGNYTNAVTFNNGSDEFNGTFSGEFFGALFVGGSFSGAHFGDGSGLFNLSASQLSSGTVPDARLAGNVARTNQVWLLNGNAGTTPGVNFVGTTDNQPLELRANNQRILLLQPDTTTNVSPNFIAGSSFNIIATGVIGSTIGGGGATIYAGQPGLNQILGNYNTIGGGVGNTTGSTNFNTAEATIAGGALNTASGITSAIGGGANNVAYGNNATIAGGLLNRANYHTFVGSGYHNWADGPDGVIGGGDLNSIQTNVAYAAIGGGYGNTIQTNASGSTIGGGYFNCIQTNASGAIIIGGYANTNFAVDSLIGGGVQNIIQAGDTYAVVGGGLQNTNGGFASTIGGGQQNNTSGGDGAVVGGGYVNANAGSAGTIGGGASNVIGPAADHATIAGGGGNTIVGSGAQPVYDTIGGGANNTILTNTSYDVIGGGQQNTNSGNNTTVGGGFANTVSNLAATIPGGYKNVASGNVSFAAGEFAQATNNGSFVWSDGSGQVTTSTNDNSVTMRAAGGFRFFTSSANPSPGAYLAPFATSWTALSDRNAKKDFAPVNYQAVLDKLARVPVVQWHYKWESSGDTPNLGPMAQDFKAAFYPGRDDKGISTLEFDGVELAAIQGLNEKLNEKDAEIQTLKQQNDSLAQRLNELEVAVKQLAANK